MSSSKVARRKESSSVASKAEAFEQSLRGGGDAPDGFVQNNPKLASMLRLMSHLFGGHDTKSFEGDNDRQVDVAPEKIGRFIIKQKLGAGGFGTVYLADDEVLHRQVAVKVIRPVETDGNTRHWLEEARVIARLSHPNLVPLYEVVEDGALLGFVSEYCDGPTLAQWIQSHPSPIDVHAAASLVEKLADGVAYVHLKGLVHRDIKPSNVLLDVGNAQGDEPIIIPRLTDFGLAREAKHPDVESSPASWAGTLQYVAPEQFLRTEYVDGPGVDIYGLGVLLYRLLTGQLPHVEEDPVKLVTGICETPPLPLRSLRRDIPRDLEAICMRCLEKQPGLRYQSATELAEELRRFRDGSEVRARQRSGAEKLLRLSLAHPITSGLAGAIIVVSVVATGLMLQKNRTLHKQRQLLSSSLEEVSRQNSVVEAGWLRDQQVTYHANIERAYAAFWNQNYSDSRTTLDATQDYLDRFPGGRLAYKILDRMLSDRAVSLPSHEGSIEEIVYVPGRELFVVAGLEGRVRVHRASDGEL
jgi:serine/threonine protein kinase